jgi:hypothetical protein
MQANVSMSASGGSAGGGVPSTALLPAFVDNRFLWWAVVVVVVVVRETRQVRLGTTFLKYRRMLTTLSHCDARLVGSNQTQSSHSIFSIPEMERERENHGKKENCISQVSARKKKEGDLRYLTYHAPFLSPFSLLVHPRP